MGMASCYRCIFSVKNTPEFVFITHTLDAFCLWDKNDDDNKQINLVYPLNIKAESLAC